MHILWFTDCHLRTEHIEKGEKFLNLLISKVEELKPDLVVNTGDTFHTKDKTFLSLAQLYRNALMEITKHSEVVHLVGNHDWGSLYETHALSQITDIPRLHTVDNTLKIDNLGFTAYFRDDTRMKKSLKALSGSKYLFGHFDIDGFKLGSGWEEVGSISTKDTFLDFEYVCSGHYHLGQEWASKNGNNIIYCGSPYTIDFGESDQKKRMLLIDTTTGEFTDIPTEMTLHKTLIVDASTGFNESYLNSEILKGVELRVTITGTKEEVDELERNKPKGLKAKITTNIIGSTVTRKDASKAISGAVAAMSEELIVEEFIRMKSAKDKIDLDRTNKIVSLAMKYMKNAKK